MALNTCETWSIGNEIAFIFQKNYKNSSSGWGLLPQPHLWHVWVTLYCSLLNTSFDLDIWTFGSSLLPQAKSWLRAKPGRGFDLPLYDIFVLQKFPFSKIFDDVIVCEFWFGTLPQWKSWLRLWGGVTAPHWQAEYAKYNVFRTFETDFCSKSKNIPPLSSAMRMCLLWL